MKKKLLAFFTVLALAASLPACKAASDETGTEQATDQATEAEAGDLLADASEDAAEEIAEPEHVTVSLSEPYGDTNIRMELLGLQEYESLEGEDYTDTPQEGNAYLVLFVNIQNRTIEGDYINPGLLSAAVDGNAIENTFLVNNPENYSSIFQHMDVMSEQNGYIVWEVPADWETLSFTYSGWEYTANVIISGEVTPDDLCAPPAIDE